MTTAISFRGGESTGGVADRKIETAKQETTGGVGIRNNPDSVFTVDNELKADTVCFKGYAAEESNKKMSPLAVALTVLGGTAFVVGGLGLAHKYDVVGKYIKNEKVKEFFRHTDAVTEPCHKACAWFKKNCYDKVVKFFTSQK